MKIFKNIVVAVSLFAVIGLPHLAEARKKAEAAVHHTKKKEYTKAFKKWTRSAELYQREDFYASMSWHVTKLSDEFLNAQINEVSRIYDYDASEENKYREEIHAQLDGYTVFFLSFYGYDFKEADLDKKGSVWTVRMESNGERLEPVKMQEIRKTSALQRQLFPYINPWSRYYFVFFPKRTGSVELQINGPFSHGSLKW